MKVIVKAILAVMLILPIGAFAQSKVGHVNTQKLLEAMPEVKVANAKLDTLNKSYQAQMKELIDEYQKKVADFQDPSHKWPSDLIKGQKQKEIEQLGERIQAFKEDANSDIQKKTEELMTPIRKKLSEAIKDVAATGKYNLVLDSSQAGIVLYTSDSDDLTDAIKKKLGQ
jgi:outer membrane protein